jgi:hypothetical protein
MVRASAWWSPSSRLRAVTLATLLLCPSLAGAAAVCPARPSDIVQSIDVFDGAPAELAYLAADGRRNGADVFTLGQIRAAGRAVVVRCKYRSGASVDVEVAAAASECMARLENSGNVRVTCH